MYTVEKSDGKTYVMKNGEIHLPCIDSKEAEFMIDQLNKGESELPSGDDSNFYVIAAINASRTNS